MTQINIPSITIDTPLTYTLDLRAEGQPLHGLHLGRHTWSRLTQVRVWEERAGWHGGDGSLIGFRVRTVGLAPQTRRDKTFRVDDRAAMVAYVNEWIAKTVAAGLKRLAEQQAQKNSDEQSHRRRMAESIEQAGGIEARRQEIVREAFDLAAKDSMQRETSEVYGAVLTALTHNAPIALDESTRAKIIERYEREFKEGYVARRHIDREMQKLEDYLNEIKQEEAA